MSLEKVVDEIKNEIERLTQVLHLLSGGRTKGKWRKKMSVAARKRISQAQKKRWEKVKRARKK